MLTTIATTIKTIITANGNSATRTAERASPMFILRTDCGKVYTGRAGEGWVSANDAEAFRMGRGEAERKAAMFNERTMLHRLTFNVEG